jgi:glutamine cyclotransferase
LLEKIFFQPFFLVLFEMVRHLIFVIITLWSVIISCESKAPVISYRVMESFPHNVGYFTEGLVYSDGFMYEVWIILKYIILTFVKGTGLYGSSKIVKYNISTSTELKQQAIDRNLFGEVTRHS